MVKTIVAWPTNNDFATGKLDEKAGLTVPKTASNVPASQPGSQRFSTTQRRPFGGCLARWRSGYAAACKAVYTGSIPVRASNTDPV